MTAIHAVTENTQGAEDERDVTAHRERVLMEIYSPYDEMS